MGWPDFVTVGPKFVGPTFHFQGGQTFCPPWDFDLDHVIQGRKRTAVKVPLGINVQVELSLELNMDGLNVKAEQILQVPAFFTKWWPHTKIQPWPSLLYVQMFVIYY
jgi:hypothetical protein